MANWIVTGGSSGIGAQLVDDLLKAGEEVHIWDRHPPQNENGAKYQQVDLCKTEQLQQAAALFDFPLNAFVHCAGTGVASGIGHPGLADHMRLAFELHTVSFVVSVQMLLDQLIRGKGSVIGIASAAMDVVYPGTLAYGASKAALRRSITQLAVELGGIGIRVNGVAPGAIATPLTAPTWADPDFAAKRLTTIPLGVQGRPESISSLVRYLASDQAQYITGETINVDGGVRHGIFNHAVRAAGKASSH